MYLTLTTLSSEQSEPTEQSDGDPEYQHVFSNRLNRKRLLFYILFTGLFMWGRGRHSHSNNAHSALVVLSAIFDRGTYRTIFSPYQFDLLG
jgi:hypothetical protein